VDSEDENHNESLEELVTLSDDRGFVEDTGTFSNNGNGLSYSNDEFTASIPHNH